MRHSKLRLLSQHQPSHHLEDARDVLFYTSAPTSHNRPPKPLKSTMRVSLALLAVAGSTQAFCPAPPAAFFGSSTSLAMVKAETTSGLTMQKVRKTISELNSDNFVAKLEEIEPFLLHDAGATMYTKSMQRITVRAKALGVDLPAKYAKEAKATEKKREKQNAFIQTKEEERLAAEAEAAEAAAAAAAAAEEAPVEEKELIEA